MENNAKTQSNTKSIVKFFLGAIVLVLVFAMLFHYVSLIFVHPEDGRSYDMIHGLYEEEDNSLDAVFLGASTTYAFWNPMVAWENFGITGYSFTTPSQCFSAQLYMCQEARKTQPDAVYVFNLSAFTEYFDKTYNLSFHMVLDFLPFSMTKLAMTKNMIDSADPMSAEEQLEYYIPLIRYHSTWDSLDGDNFDFAVDPYRGSPTYRIYIEKRTDVTDRYKIFDGYAPFTEETRCIQEDVQETLDYIKKENLKAVFIASPISDKPAIFCETVNSAVKMVENAGITVLDLRQQDAIDEMRLDLSEDYYNGRHTNIHGCLKTTKYLAEHIMKEFDIKDKRNDASYLPGKSWTEASKQYKEEFLETYVLDQEYHYEIDYDSATPGVRLESLGDGKVKIAWDAVEGADTYEVYKRHKKTQPWEKIATLPGDTTEVDNTDTPGEEVFYTLIAKVGDQWTNYYERGKSIVA